MQVVEAADTRQLAITHADFYRLIGTTVFDPEQISIDKNNATAVLSFCRGEILISLDPEQSRTIGSLRLPATRIHFQFRHLDQSEISEYRARFARSFHRGGG